MRKPLVKYDFANAPLQIFYHMAISVQYVLKLQVYSCMHAFLEKMKVKKRENTDLLLGEAVLEAHDVLHFQLGLQL
jgi:hypothetical protein